MSATTEQAPTPANMMRPAGNADAARLAWPDAPAALLPATGPLAALAEGWRRVAAGLLLGLVQVAPSHVLPRGRWSFVQAGYAARHRDHLRMMRRDAA
ncbi:hypothetical protein GCM10011504_38410 [Siccirubricoccus deserti]|uniref:Uncharacterized protein n=1 Tax=Siccirubricoccus deserti TaxID=2013562 RepID=A0A9X0QZW7_9PROT|nr:hypothetical protein [Siccirubricoccus deserti]MBC4017071.1 hypothetical protein [Siccirubricoccus deserti]GGC56368.1 hypothetical protein GCM10011504_38410 [Siccirubricoccus deserti]